MTKHKYTYVVPYPELLAALGIGYSTGLVHLHHDTGAATMRIRVTEHQAPQPGQSPWLRVHAVTQEYQVRTWEIAAAVYPAITGARSVLEPSNDDQELTLTRYLEQAAPQRPAGTAPHGRAGREG